MDFLSRLVTNGEYCKEIKTSISKYKWNTFCIKITNEELSTNIHFFIWLTAHVMLEFNCLTVE